MSIFEQKTLAPWEFDPEYRHAVHFIREWLNDGAPGHGLQIPIRHEPAFVPAPLGIPTGLDFPARLLTAWKAWAPAPYVGRPFAYVWLVAIDELGRQVAAGKAEIVYPFDDERTWELACRLVEMVAAA